jgi:hypothetical protein
MLATLFHCLDLLRLSGSPADLPSSRTQLLSLLVLDVLVQAMALAVLGLPQALWFELLLTRLAGIWLMLWLRGHPARYVQTLTALFGVSLLLSCGFLAVSVGHRVAAQVPMLLMLFDLIAAGLLGWLWLAGGLVLARAMALPMPFGVLAVIALHVLPQALRVWLVPVAPAG